MLVRLTFDFHGAFFEQNAEVEKIVYKHWKNLINENKTQLLIIDSVFERFQAMQSKQASKYVCMC